MAGQGKESRKEQSQISSSSDSVDDGDTKRWKILAETRLGYRRLGNRLERCSETSRGWRAFNVRLNLLAFER